MTRKPKDNLMSAEKVQNRPSLPRQKLVAKYTARREFNRGEIDRIFEDIDTNSNDRAVALIAGGFVEIMLAHFIEAKLFKATGRAMTENEATELFEGLGPFHTFDLKIKFAAICDIIDDNIKKDLDRIRKIRNYFAHEIDDVSFENENVSAECANLNYWKAAKGNIDGLDKARAKFIATAKLVLAMISLRMVKDVVAMHLASKNSSDSASEKTESQ